MWRVNIPQGTLPTRAFYGPPKDVHGQSILCVHEDYEAISEDESVIIQATYLDRLEQQLSAGHIDRSIWNKACSKAFSNAAETTRGNIVRQNIMDPRAVEVFLGILFRKEIQLLKITHSPDLRGNDIYGLHYVERRVLS